MEVDFPVAPLSAAPPMPPTEVGLARFQALHRGPRLEQGAVDREVIVGEQLQPLRFGQHRREELPRYLVLEQPTPVLGKRRLVEGIVLDVEVQEPLEEEA